MGNGHGQYGLMYIFLGMSIFPVRTDDSVDFTVAGKKVVFVEFASGALTGDAGT